MRVTKLALAISSCSFCLGLAPTVPACAAQTNEAPTALPSADGQGLADIVVTAQRRSESLQRTPVAVSVITADALAKKAITSESDLQASVPGLTIRTGITSNLFNYSLRGQSVDLFSFSPPAVLPYVNEVQASSGGSSAFYDLQSVQILKGPQGTLFGRNATGGAVLFTTAKPTNLFEGYVTGRLGNYSQRYLESAVNIPLVDDRVLVRVAGVLQHRDGFQHDIFDGRTYGTVKRQAIRGSLTLKPTDTIKNELMIDYQHSGGSDTVAVVQNVYPVGFNAAPLPANFLFSPAVDQLLGSGAWNRYLANNPRADPAGFIAFAEKQRARGPYAVSVGSFPFHRAHNIIITNVTTFDLGADTQLKNVFGHIDGAAHDNPDQDGSPFAVADDDYRTTSRSTSEELQLIGKVAGGDLSYIVGGYYATERNAVFSTQDLANLFPVLPIFLQINNFSNRTRSLAGYAQGTYDLSMLTGLRGLSVTAGVRYTAEKVESSQLPGSQYFNLDRQFPAARNTLSKTFRKPSWQLGIQEQVNPDLLLYAVTRRSFRSGGFNGASAPLPGTASVGGSAFLPEIATDAELGVKFSGRIGDVPVRLNVAAYTMWVKDIQRTLFTFNPVVSSNVALDVNIPKAVIRGIELDAQIRPARWFNFGGSLALTDPEFTKDTASVFGQTTRFSSYPDTPRVTGTVFAEVSGPLPDDIGTLALRGDVYAQSKFYYSSQAKTTVPGTTLPGYALVNMRLGLDDIRSSGLSLSVNAKNMLNKTYFTGGEPGGQVFTFNAAGPGERRTIFAEVRYKW